MIQHWLDEQEKMESISDKSKGYACDASWQVSVKSGNLYVIKCRNCKTIIQDGCTPKCLLK